MRSQYMMCVFLEMQSLYLYFKILTVINNFSSICGANYVLYAYIDYGTKFTIAPFKKRKEYASLIQKKSTKLINVITNGLHCWRHVRLEYSFFIFFFVTLLICPDNSEQKQTSLFSFFFTISIPALLHTCQNHEPKAFYNLKPPNKPSKQALDEHNTFSTDFQAFQVSMELTIKWEQEHELT